MNDSDLQYEHLPRQSFRYKLGLVVVGVAAGILLRLVFPPDELFHGPVYFEPMTESGDSSAEQETVKPSTQTERL